ncbi:MAG: flagellar basal body rod protein FlgC [Pseudomonadota bacterium]
MDSFLKAIAAASSGMDAQSTRLRTISENIANADTPGFRRKLVTFESVLDRSTGATRLEIGDVSLDPSELELEHRPGHPLADANGYVEMSNVDMLVELADAREAQRSYEANLRMFDQARKMKGSILDLLKR